jgi:hypothetical protein
MDTLPARTGDAYQKALTWDGRKNRKQSGVLRDVAANLWSTPTVQDCRETDGAMRPSRIETGRTTEYLNRQAVQATWPTPNAADHRDRGNITNPCIQRRIANGQQIDLSMVAKGLALEESSSQSQPLTSGETVNTSPAGQLGCEFVEWLMGLPPGWTEK